MTTPDRRARTSAPAGRHKPGRAGLEAVATGLSLVVLATVLGVQLAAPHVWETHGWVVLVVGLLAGLPHGAADHLVPGYLLREHAPRVILVVAGYAATAVVAWALFRSMPAVALTVFVGLSALHFGAGEVAFDEERRRATTTRTADAGASTRVPLLADPLAVLATGGAALLLPVLREPSTTAPLVALLVPGSSGLLPSWLTTAGVTAVLVSAALTRRLRHRRWLDATEVTLLVAVGMLVDPLAAFGAYFGAWHSLRHIARTVAEDPANATDLRAGRPLRPLARFARAAVLPTAVSLAALTGLWALADGWRGFVTANLALLAGLTVPHVLVVTWWDRRDAHTTPPPLRGATTATSARPHERHP